MSKTTDPRPHPNVEQQRKRAKELRRAHGAGSLDAAERIVGHLPRARGKTAAQVLACSFTLSEAHLVVAREAGFSSWPRLKHHIELSQLGVDGALEAILTAAIVGDSAAVQAVLAGSPELPRRSIHVATVLGDAQAALPLLVDNPSLALQRGGLRQWTPLYFCCSSRHGRGDAAIAGARARVVERLLALGADPNDEISTYDEPGGFRSALQGAARDVASAELLGVLLEAGASLLPHGSAGRTPLTDAVSGGNPACLERLLATRPPAWQAREALEFAIFHDRPDMARQLVEYGAEPSAAGRSWGYGGSCLHAAILLRRTNELLDVLLATDVDISKRDRDGRTAYVQAVRTGHEVAADLLRERGASEDELSDVDRVIAACMRLRTREVRRLLDADPTLKAMYRETDHLMLGWAIRNGRAAAVPLLLEAGLDPSVVDYSEGDTALHFATAAGHEDAAAALLAAGASSTARNYRGRTPYGESLAAEEQGERDKLFERAADAVAFGELETLRELLDGEPDLVHWRSPRVHRATLLLYCGANGTESPRQRTPPNAPAIAQLLLDRGADPNAPGNFYGGGATTIGLVMTSQFPINADLDADLVRVLVRAGAQLDGSGRIPMFWAIERGRYRSALVLAEAGVPVDNLLFAAALDRRDLLEELLSRGIDVNTRHAGGLAALHAAALMGHKEAVAFLLERGADRTLRDTHWNDTASEKARWLKHTEVAEIIEKQ